MSHYTKASLSMVAIAATMLAGCGADEPGRIVAGDTSASDSDVRAPVNHPPEIIEVVLRPSQPRRGDTLQAEVRATDPDGDPVTLEYEWRIDGRRAEASGASLSPPDLGQGQEIEVSVTVHDGSLYSPPSKASVRLGNQPPMLIGIDIRPKGEVHGDADLMARASATDPEGDAIEYRYSWRVNGSPRGDDSDTLPAGLFKRGDEIVVSAVATDGSFESEELRSDPIEVGNAPPQIVSEPKGFGADGIFRYRIVAEDVDGDSHFTYRLLGGPDGMVIDSLNGQMVWKPRESQAGTHIVEFEVGDRHGGTTTQSFQLELSFERTAVPAAGSW